MSGLLSLFEDRLFDAPSGEDAVNPWRDTVEELDIPAAAETRRENLAGYLRGLAPRPGLLLVGEAPGWRGCRFSGIPFTSESQLHDPGFPVGGRRTSRGRPPLSEISASIVWGALESVHPRFLLWNVFPFHPHPADTPLANRRPRAAERRRFLPVLRSVCVQVAPRRIVAVGRTAEEGLRRLGMSCTYVRHPAQGGATLFRDGIGAILEEERLI